MLVIYFLLNDVNVLLDIKHHKAACSDLFLFAESA